MACKIVFKDKTFDTEEDLLKYAQENKIPELLDVLQPTQKLYSLPVTDKQVLKDLGLVKKEYSDLQRNLRNKRLKEYNQKNNTSYFIFWNQVGEANLYNWNIVDKANKGLPNQEGQGGGSQGQLFQTNISENSPIKQLDAKLKTFLQKAGVHVEETNDALENDAIAVYNLTNQVIKVSKGKANENTLPEETGHVIDAGLGENHPLIKSLTDKIKEKPDWKSLLDPQYIEKYGDNEDLLLRELRGQLIGKELVDQYYKKYPKTWDNIKRIARKIIDKFFSLFSSIPQSDIDKFNKETKDLTNQIVNTAFTDNNFKAGKYVGTETLNSLLPKFKRRDLKETKKEPKMASSKKLDIIIHRYNKQIKQLENKKELFPEEQRRLDSLKEQLKNYKQEKNVGYLQILAESELNEVEKILKNPDIVEALPEQVEAMREVINTFRDWEGFEQQSNKLFNQLIPFEQKYLTKLTNQYTNQEVELSDVLATSKDIGRYQRWVGSLADVGDIAGQTVASVIKSAQNQISRKKEQNAEELTPEINALKKYQSIKGVKEADIYNIFIQKIGKTTKFVKPYNTEYYEQRNQAGEKLGSSNAEIQREGKKWFSTNGDWNEEGKYTPKKKWQNQNYNTIQSTPELKRFYDFFKSEVKKVIDKLPVKSEVYEDFIPNKKADWMESIMSGDRGMKTLFKDFVTGIGTDIKLDKDGEALMYDEDFASDRIPMKFLSSLSSDIKSKDLGDVLLNFVNFGDQYETMEEVLPKVRIIQDVIKSKSYINSHGNSTINGENTNIIKLIDDYVTTQVKGETKKKEGKLPFNFSYTDEEGNKINKDIYASDIADSLRGYNSLLRIGLNPMNAFNNVAWGALSNRIEATGGRYFTHAELNKAEKIFWQQGLDDNSKFSKILRLLEPLQELEDYELTEKNKLGRKYKRVLSTNFLFKLQKGGEYYLQTVTMVANLLHDNIETFDGKKINLWDAFTEDNKGNLIWNSKDTGIELNQVDIDKLSSKIQGLNQVIHGRYSGRDASAANQYFLFRLAIQFRKWIPTAVEQRGASYRYNDRLQIETEGRYITVFKKLLPELTKGTFGNGQYRTWGNLLNELWKTRNDIREGKVFSELELYNVRKQITETAVLASILLLGYAWFGGNPSKNKNNTAMLKFMLDQTSRISSDIGNFYNPNFYLNLATTPVPISKTAADLMKVFYYMPYLFSDDKKAYYSKGNKKGENKEFAAITNLIPVGNQARAGVRYFNGQPLLNNSAPDFMKK